MVYNRNRGGDRLADCSNPDAVLLIPCWGSMRHPVPNPYDLTSDKSLNCPTARLQARKIPGSEEGACVELCLRILNAVDSITCHWQKETIYSKKEF